MAWVRGFFFVGLGRVGVVIKVIFSHPGIPQVHINFSTDCRQAYGARIDEYYFYAWRLTK